MPVLGNNPVYAPGLLAGPAGPALKQNMVIASPVPTFDQQQDLLKDFTAKYPGATPPSLGVVHGYADALVMSKILEKACQNGDLTPQGVTKAKASADQRRHQEPRRPAGLQQEGLAVQPELHPAAGRRPRWRQAAPGRRPRVTT